MTWTVSKPAGWERAPDALLHRGLTTPARALARRLADGPGVLTFCAIPIGPLVLAAAVGWRPALRREAQDG